MSRCCRRRPEISGWRRPEGGTRLPLDGKADGTSRNPVHSTVVMKGTREETAHKRRARHHRTTKGSRGLDDWQRSARHHIKASIKQQPTSFLHHSGGASSSCLHAPSEYRFGTENEDHQNGGIKRRGERVFVFQQGVPVGFLFLLSGVCTTTMGSAVPWVCVFCLCVWSPGYTPCC